MNLPFWITIIKSIILPLIGVYLVSKFNIFDYFNFVPSKQTFNIGVITYLALLECLCAKATDWIEKNFSTNVECIFYCNERSKNISNTPQFIFVEEVVYIHCLISLKGSASRLVKNSLIISFPKWAEIQNANNTIGVINNNQYTVDFSRIIDKNDKFVEKATADLKIGLIKKQSNDELSKIIAPSLSKKIMCNFSTNKFELKNK